MTDGDRYRRKLLLLLSRRRSSRATTRSCLRSSWRSSSATSVGARPTPGWIRAITQLGRSPGSCSQGIGCKRLLLITIVGYTATTALTAVSPGLIWLTVARFGAQGFLGAEWAVAITIVVRSSPENIVARRSGSSPR
jgi:MFS family permease